MISITENLQKIKDPQRVNRNIVLRVEKLLPMPDRITLQKTLYVIDVKRRDIFNPSVSLRKQSTQERVIYQKNQKKHFLVQYTQQIASHTTEYL